MADASFIWEARDAAQVQVTDAEQAVLGAMLMGSHGPEHVADLSASDFVTAGHPEIFASIRRLDAADVVVDVVTVFENMRDAGLIFDGLAEYLNALAGAVPSASNIKAYTDILHRRRTARRWEANRARALSALTTAGGAAEALERVRDIFQSENIPARPDPTWHGPGGAQVGADWLDAQLPEEAFVVAHLLPVDAIAFIGAGGVGKSTFLLWLLVHVILGKEVMGLEVLRPGPVLYISAEDRRDTIERRLQRVCDALELTRSEKEDVAAQFFIEDVSGKVVRLVVEEQGRITSAPEVDELIEAYRQIRPVVTVLDPISLLGPGERLVNDGMSELMRTARRISLALQSAVVQVHHESKVGNRTGVADQYAGRGGAAFADNARAVLQLIPFVGQKLSQEAGTDWPLPSGWDADDVTAGNVNVLLVHKLTAERRDRRPLFIRRHGYLFEARRAVGLASAEVMADTLGRLEPEIIKILTDGLTGEEKVPHSARSLKEEIVARKVGSRAQAELALTALLQRGVVRHLDLPAKHPARRGARTNYLVPCAQPRLFL